MSFRRFFNKNRIVLYSYFTVIILFVFISILRPGFASMTHIKILIEESAIIGIVAIGQTLVILTGGIDLSVAWVINTAAVAVTTLSNKQNDNLLIVAILVMAVTFIIGLINGFAVAYIRVPPIIMTLGMNTILQGALLAITHGAPGNAAPTILEHLTSGTLIGFPILLIIWIILSVIVSITLKKTPFGRRIYAIGNNETVSIYSGINVKRNKMMVYGISGLTAGITGMLVVGRYGLSYLGIGDPFQFQCIAAVAIGGTSLMGGSGNYIGTIAGALTITILLGLLNALSLPEGAQRAVYGLVVLLSAMVSAYNRSSLKRKPIIKSANE